MSGAREDGLRGCLLVPFMLGLPKREGAKKLPGTWQLPSAFSPFLSCQTAIEGIGRFLQVQEPRGASRGGERDTPPLPGAPRATWRGRTQLQRGFPTAPSREARFPGSSSFLLSSPLLFSPLPFLPFLLFLFTFPSSSPSFPHFSSHTVSTSCCPSWFNKHRSTP